MIGLVEAEASAGTAQLNVEVRRGQGLAARLEARRRSQRRFRVVVGICFVVLVVATATLSVFTYSLSRDRAQSRDEVRLLTAKLEQGAARESDVSQKLNVAQTRLDQLSTDATGKDGVIKGLQDETAAKQAQIDALTNERSALKGCLDGVTLALVQLTNDGSASARATIDGVRDVCRQAEVLL